MRLLKEREEEEDSAGTFLKWKWFEAEAPVGAAEAEGCGTSVVCCSSPERRFPAAAAFDPIRPPRAPAPPRRLAATWSRALVGGRGGGQGGRVLRHQHRAGQEELGPTRSRAQEEERQEVGEEDDGGTSDGARAYEEENETHVRQVGPRALRVQRWAANEPSSSAELDCFIAYITRPQLNCSRVLPPGMSQPTQPPVASAHWLLCVEERLLPAADTLCVAYSFSLDGRDADFLMTVSRLGCEVHGFNPSTSSASDGGIGNSLASNRGNRGGVSQNELWLEWRAPRRRKHKTRGNLGGVSQTLADIMAALAHHTVHFMYADLLSAEWRVFQNWIEVGTIRNIQHLVATVHLHWAGFEVGGTDEDVRRYWFSVLRGIEASGLHLHVHSSPGSGYGVLKHSAADARSSYTLSWVNTHTRHRHSHTNMDRAEHAAVDDVTQT